MVEIVFIPQPDIMVEAHLLMMQRADRGHEGAGAWPSIRSRCSCTRSRTRRSAARRSSSSCSIVQNAQAVGFFATDIPYGSDQISRFGVEETVVDGVILLTSTEEGLERQRYIEVYKLRNTAHLKGRHNMVDRRGRSLGLPALRRGRRGRERRRRRWRSSSRLSSGVPGLDELLGGGLLERSVTLVSGSAGIGKSTLRAAVHPRGRRSAKEPGLYVTLEEGPEQLLASAEALGLPLRAAVDEGLVEILYSLAEHIRAGQFLTVLADRIQALKARRVVLDAATQMLTERMAPDELRQLLYKLVVRFKTLGVTSLLTLEAASLYSTERVTELGLSPIADNLLMLRYQEAEGRARADADGREDARQRPRPRDLRHHHRPRGACASERARGATLRAASDGPGVSAEAGAERRTRTRPATRCRRAWSGIASGSSTCTRSASSSRASRTSEQTFDPALGIAARTLPLRSAILIETEDGRSKMIVWSSEGQSSEQMRAARSTCRRPTPISSELPRPSLDAERAGGHDRRCPGRRHRSGASRRGSSSSRWSWPRPPFGALQLEGAQALDKTDLMFVNAIANQLAIALDRDRAWRRDIARREHAEEGEPAERGRHAERERIVAEGSSSKYEALAGENARLYEQAQQAVRVREQILAIVSHDLRNPLGTILLTSSLLAGERRSEERREELSRRPSGESSARPSACCGSSTTCSTSRASRPDTLRSSASRRIRAR